MIKSSERINSSYIFLIFLVVGFIVWGDVINYKFTLDDHDHITENHIFTELLGFKTIFTTPTWPGNLYRPIAISSIYLDYIISNGSISFLHFTNLLFHILSTFCLYVVLKDYFSKSLALFISLLFLVHPINQEIVANISTRNESLTALFVLLSIYIANNAFNNNVIIKLSSIFTFYSFALLTKESALSGFILIPLFFWIKARDIGKTLKISTALTISTLFYLGIRTSIVGAPKNGVEFVGDLDNIFVHYSYLQRLPNVIGLLGNYLTDIALPLNIFQDYSYPMVSVCELTSCAPKFYLSLCLVILLISFTIYQFIKKNYIFSAFAGWFFITSALYSNILILTINHYAPRYMYLPSMGILVTLGIFIEKINIKSINLLLKFVFFVGFSYISFKDLPRWKDDFELRLDEVARGNISFKSNSNFAMYMLKNGRYDQAIRFASIAEQSFPNTLQNLNILQLAYYMSGDHENSKEITKKMISYHPDSEFTHEAIAWRNYYENNFEVSKVEFEKTLMINNSLISPQIGLLLIYIKENNIEKIKESLAKIPNESRNDPRFKEAELAMIKMGVSG